MPRKLTAVLMDIEYGWIVVYTCFDQTLSAQPAPCFVLIPLIVYSSFVVIEYTYCASRLTLMLYKKKAYCI